MTTRRTTSRGTRASAALLLLAAHVAAAERGRLMRTEVGVAERDVVEPLDQAVRMSVARRLLEGAGFSVGRAPDPIGRVDPLAIVATRH